MSSNRTKRWSFVEVMFISDCVMKGPSKGERTRPTPSVVMVVFCLFSSGHSSPGQQQQQGVSTQLQCHGRGHARFSPGGWAVSHSWTRQLSDQRDVAILAHFSLSGLSRCSRRWRLAAGHWPFDHWSQLPPRWRVQQPSSCNFQSCQAGPSCPSWCYCLWVLFPSLH